MPGSLTSIQPNPRSISKPSRKATNLVWDVRSGLLQQPHRALHAQCAGLPAGKQGRRVVSAFIATAFAQNDTDAGARPDWRQVADHIRPKVRKLADLMDEAEADVLAYMSFPVAHRTKLHSTNPIERLNGEIKRRTEVVGIFPNEDAITRLVGAILLEQNDEWQLQHRYMQLEAMAELAPHRPMTSRRRNFHPRPPDQWPPQTAPKFPPH